MKTIAEQAQEAALEHSCSLLRAGFRPSAATERGDHYELGYLAAAVRREELIAELVGVCNKALEALRNVPFVGDIYDQQHSDTHQRAALSLSDAIAKAEGRSP